MSVADTWPSTKSPDNDPWPTEAYCLGVFHRFYANDLYCVCGAQERPPALAAVPPVPPSPKGQA